MGKPDPDRLDQIVARAQRERAERERGYRARALKLFPWVCARCTRTFERHNLHELTVHHIDHNHDHNPDDGSNWELLCLYCHDQEHQQGIQSSTKGSSRSNSTEGCTPRARHTPFAQLGDLLQGKKSDD